MSLIMVGLIDDDRNIRTDCGSKNGSEIERCEKEMESVSVGLRNALNKTYRSSNDTI